MKETVIKGAGNSRSLRTVPNALTLYPTTQAMLQAMIDGTFPIDLGPLNPAGLVQRGTDLNPANLLSDETAALYPNLPEDPTPNDAFSSIALGLFGSKQEVFQWVRTRDRMEYSPIVKSANVRAGFSGNSCFYVWYSYSIAVNENGITLINPSRYRSDKRADETTYNTRIPILDGRYFVIGQNAATSNLSFCYKASEELAFVAPSGYDYGLGPADKIGIKSTSVTDTEIVTSTDPNAYPVEGDGWTYTKLPAIEPQPGRAQIRGGAYIGTGQYGSNSPSSLTFPFKPKLVLIALNDAAQTIIFINGVSVTENTDNNQKVFLTWEGNKVQWHATTYPSTQMNISGKTYNYVAIG